MGRWAPDDPTTEWLALRPRLTAAPLSGASNAMSSRAGRLLSTSGRCRSNFPLTWHSFQFLWHPTVLRPPMPRIFTGENEPVGVEGRGDSIFTGENRADSLPRSRSTQEPEGDQFGCPALSTTITRLLETPLQSARPSWLAQDVRTAVYSVRFGL